MSTPENTTDGCHNEEGRWENYNELDHNDGDDDDDYHSCDYDDYGYDDNDKDNNDDDNVADDMQNAMKVLAMTTFNVLDDSSKRKNHEQ